MNRSLAFTAALERVPGFGDLSPEAAARVIDRIVQLAAKTCAGDIWLAAKVYADTLS